MKHITHIKASLRKAIRHISDQKEQFVWNSKTDFTRRKKLDFPTMLRFLLQMEGSTIRNELTDYFHDSPDCPSPSAFYQQRLKIKPDALYMLFRTFTAQYKGTRWKGYRLLAVDGSTIYTPRNEKDASSYLFNGAGKKGWNCVHMNALYDLMDGLYVDAAVHPGKKPGEQAALKPMLDRLSDPGHSIIIGDRGYESFQMVADLEARGIPFVIRVKKPSSNWGFLAKADFPEQKEFDLPFTCKIAHANSFKGNKSRARMLGEGYRPGNRCFSYVSKDSPTYHFQPMRVVRCGNDLQEGEPVYLLTNLPEGRFGLSEIKELYKLRWGIETSFRELKYALSLLHFHSKKKDLMMQEIFARLTMYNFSHMITSQLKPEVKPGKKHARQINHTYAAKICKEYFRNKIGPSHLKALILRHTLPIRPDRHYERKANKKQPRTFHYRIS